jgi:hypothetical protein
MTDSFPSYLIMQRLQCVKFDGLKGEEIQIYKEVMTVYFKVVSQDFPGET